MDKLKLAVMSTQTVALLQMIVKSKHSFLMSDEVVILDGLLLFLEAFVRY